MRSMIPLVSVTALAIIVGLQLTSGRATEAADHSEHVIYHGEEITWERGPDSLPPGAEMALLEGDPSQEGLFTLRIRVPDGYEIPPHTHPRMERVTVLAGGLHLGMGRTVDVDAMELLPEGSFFVMPPGMEHYVRAEGETIIQLNSEGPWGIEYIDPADDPRREPR